MTQTNNSQQNFEKEPGANPFVYDAVAAAEQNGGQIELAAAKPPEEEPPYTLYNASRRLDVKKLVATVGTIAAIGGGIGYALDRGAAGAEREAQGYAQKAQEQAVERNDPARIHLNQPPSK